MSYWGLRRTLAGVKAGVIVISGYRVQVSAGDIVRSGSGIHVQAVVSRVRRIVGVHLESLVVANYKSARKQIK